MPKPTPPVETFETGQSAALTGTTDPVKAADVAEHRATMERAPVTAEAPGTQPAAVSHDRLPAPAPGWVEPPTASLAGVDLAELGTRTVTEAFTARALADEVDPLLGPNPADRPVRGAGIVDALLEHPDSVVRARAREAVASLDADAPDAGILSRAAVDTAREFDRKSGRLSYDRLPPLAGVRKAD